MRVGIFVSVGPMPDRSGIEDFDQFQVIIGTLVGEIAVDVDIILANDFTDRLAFFDRLAFAKIDHQNDIEDVNIAIPIGVTH